MSLSHLLKKINQPNAARATSVDAGTGPSSENYNELSRPQRKGTETMSRRWGKKTSSADDRLSPSPPSRTSTPPIKSMAENPTPGAGEREKPLPMPPSAGPGVFLTNLSMEPLPEMFSGSGPASDRLIETWNMVKDGPSGSNLNGGLNAFGDAVNTAQTDFTPFQPLITAAAGAIEQTAVAKSITEGIDKFFEGMPLFMNALDAVAKLHPFIGVVVLAFRTVYTLELKRRDNEKKVIALYVEMKDMMGILLLLEDVRNDKVIGPEGISIEDRLKSLVVRTADDIKLCSNACDTYMKKRLLAKVILGPSWDLKLLEFVGLFAKRRQEFEFELSIHTSQGVDKANVKLDNIGHETHALTEKMNTMMVMFQQLVSPEQKELSALVTANGGVKALRNNEKALLSLEETVSKASSTSLASAEGHRAPRSKARDARHAEDLQNAIFEEPGAAVEKNRAVFFRKFQAQMNQIVHELTPVIKRETDRVIQVMIGGPHERLLDRSIHEIWKEMGWRGNVKARHFVLTLRDYYLEKLASESTTVRGLSTSAITGSQNLDAWAIKYIDVIRLQPILEAIDDDASGYITIGEMNSFTSSRPIDWSLAHWIAFWAVGFRASIIDYAKRIEELFAKMEGVRAVVLHPNREAIDDYFNFVWEPVHSLTAAVISLPLEPSNPEKFKPYLEAEEARLDAHLKSVDYIIDGTDTFTLITGGRIEKAVFPLLYLLLKRHYEIMRTMQAKVVDPRELWYSVESVLYVHDAIRYRVEDLTNNFSQQRLDPEKQFENFAYGIFKYFHNAKALWSVNYIRNLNPSVIEYNGTVEDQNVKPEDVLKYEYSDELSLDYWVYDGHSIDDVPDYRSVESPVKDIFGHWHGYFYEDDGMRQTDGTDSMITLVLEPAEGEREVKANAWSNRRRHTLTGSWSTGENDVLQLKLKMTFATAFWSPEFFNGHFDPERDALTGVWDRTADSETSSGRMEFRRILPRHLIAYPSIKELSDNKPRALWTFAIAAVRNDIRRDSWSWSFFSQRRDDRETVISLTIRSLFFGTPPDDEEDEKLCEAVQRLTPADACFYGSKIDRIRANTWVHENAFCDSCDGCIGGARLFCLDCVNKNSEVYDTLDLCSRPECIAARVTDREDLEGVHEPNHKLVKVRTVVLDRQYGRVHTAAVKAFTRVEKICKQIAEAPKKLETESNGKIASNAEPTSDHLDDGPPTQDGAVRAEGAPEATGVENTSEESESVDGTASDTSEASQQSPEIPSGELPTCGNCKGSLSFPFWYCIFCQDNLFICNSCDVNGVPDLMRSSGKHTEGHHLIRCLAPEKAKEATSSTEQRFMSLEKRLDKMQTRFENLDDRIGNIEQLLHRLASKME